MRGRTVTIAISTLPNARVVRIVALFDLHVQASLLCTGDVESPVATLLVALNTSTHVSLLANETAQSPP